MASIRSWLISIRKDKNIKQKELAELIGIAAPSYCMIEHGIRTPSPKTAKRIASVLGFDWTKFYEAEK